MKEGASLQDLRQEIEEINQEILERLSRRAEVVIRIREHKDAQGEPLFDPEREQAMIEALVRLNRGPFSDETIRRLFMEIFHVSLGLMEEESSRALVVSRAHEPEPIRVRAGEVEFGQAPLLIAGPCAVEDEPQMEAVATLVRACGVKLLRGGAYKPRSSPYSFQGLGVRGLEILRAVGRRHGLSTLSEVMDPRLVETVAEHVDMLQIGARNMYNYELLREVGRARKPVLLKRALSATLEELMLAAEYICAEGNDQIVLCERGIRTFAVETRNTLDVSAIPLLKRMTRLPVVVDVSHAAGRKDILLPLARAVLAAGADGVMVEVHPWPALARSDAEQQLSPDEFRAFAAGLGWPVRLPADPGGSG
jgi:3-deoxy-7-phosphoheptulonate synthase/chorismate mutase